MLRIVAVLSLLCLVQSNSPKSREWIRNNDVNLWHFLGTLEYYEHQINDIVFLLDESGSIGKDRYEEVKLFTQLLCRLFFVSPAHTRPTVVSFSDASRIMVDHIGSPRDQNMCTLLQKVADLDYVGSGTATHIAMDDARKILAHARHNSKRIVIVLSDGQSNSPSETLRAADDLKRNGIIVFAVGVAEVNDMEIKAIATSINHTYSLVDFNYIKEVNKYLVGEISDASWDHADPRMCNNFCDRRADCCDSRADCYCGTRGGNYSCACAAGYSGTGHQNDCHPCPRGTYKNEVGNGACQACPDHSTTASAGSSSSSQCECLPGYLADKHVCKPVECPRLTAPPQGVLIPSTCNRTYGSGCTFRCREGFCEGACTPHPRPPSPRLCLDSGQWSGVDFYCEMRRCPALDYPDWGRHNCSGQELGFGTVCSFQCETGYDLTGPASRGCLSNGSWTEGEPRCKAITCPPLKTNIQLKVKPPSCSLQPMPFRSLCRYYCKHNYSLVSNSKEGGSVLECQANGTWSGIHLSWYCADTTPPVIKCPPSVVRPTDAGLPTALYEWAPATAVDNVFVSAPRLVRPRNLGKPPHAFPIGLTKIEYEATDSSNLTSHCSFTIEVKDKEPPSVSFCPKDIEIFHEKKTVPVKWKSPIFSDNSGKLKSITNDRRSGDNFTWSGSSPGAAVTYTATDHAGNKATCTFRVRVKPYECPLFQDPVNGKSACDGWIGGKLCSAFCHDGYEFASREVVPATFMCRQAKGGRSQWVPFPGGGKQYRMPLPDCTRKSKRSAINVTQQVDLEVDYCNEEILMKMKEKFILTIMPLEHMMQGMICPKHKGCSPQNVKISCTGPKRFKRGTESDRKSRVTISFDIMLIPQPNNVRPVVDVSKISRKRLQKKIELITFKNVKDFYNITKKSMKSSFEVEAICNLGQLKKNGSCVSCPPGTYLPVIGDNCVDCPRASFQDKAGSVSCQPCPAGYTTDGTGTRVASDCRGPCQPGHFSRTTFEPCLPCPVNAYQNNSGSQECVKCPEGLRSQQVGATSLEECVSPCPAGFYSASGLEPCHPCERSLYQNETGQAECIACPDGKGTRGRGSLSLDDCVEIDACAEQNPCPESATCISIPGGDYSCACPLGLFGNHCEQRTDPCGADACANGGTCEADPEGGYRCICQPGFGGTACEIDLDDCKDVLCRNGGTCIDQVNDFECICPVGFEGAYCEINKNDCASHPCLHGGTCFDMINDYRCCCPQGYTGKDCSALHDPCAHIDCNRGVCSDDGICECPVGYTGPFCEDRADPCDVHDCLHGGSCMVNGSGDPECICDGRYTGLHCEKASPGPDFTLHFPSPASTQHFVPLQNRHVLSEVTVSFFARTTDLDIGNRPTPVSYAYMEPDGTVQDNGFTLYDLNRVILYLHGEAVHTRYEASKDSKWHHYAVTWARQDGGWSFYVDRTEVASGKGVGEESYLRPGVFVIGQEQDSLGGSFSIAEAFAGDIYQLNVWDWSMSGDEVRSISKTCGRIGNVVSWTHARNQDRVAVVEDTTLCAGVPRCSSNECDCFTSAGSSCRPQVPSCSNQPCANGQPCETSSDGHYFCRCGEGFTGRHCESDVDECALGSSHCSHLCFNTHGSYECGCLEDLRLSLDGRTCIDGGFCRKGEQIYLDGEKWIDGCYNYLCDKGEIVRQEMHCERVACETNSTQDLHLIRVNNECCPRCISYSTCILFPNATLVTFHGKVLNISESLQTPLVEECARGQYSTRLDAKVGNDSDLFSGLVFHNGCTELLLLPAILFSDSPVNQLQLQFPVGVTFKLNRQEFLSILVPSEATDPLCGLCT